MDIDGTLTMVRHGNESYLDLAPNSAVLNRLLELRAAGWRIILYTSRSMRTYNGNVGEIVANSAPILFNWLEKHQVPYDEIHFGKPWCGWDGFYVDDKAVRPREFATLSLDEINNLLEKGKI